MTRWIVLLVLLASCGGCALYDDMVYDQPAYMQPAPSSCGMPAGYVTQAQSVEPPR